MAAAKARKHKPVAEATTDKPVRALTGAGRQLKATAVGSTGSRSPLRGRPVEATSGRRTRAASTAPRAERDQQHRRRALSCGKHPVERRPCPGAREQRCTPQSHKAFTVIPPNPKKRRELQMKAEAELSALEELRLSRAMAYVSIDPSRVGGCMSLEEVRLKQQEEMMQARKKPKQTKKQVLEQTFVLLS